VLTELPEIWRECVRRWSRAHRPLKRALGRRRVPDVYSEYLLYQTLAGIWPAPPTSVSGDWAPDDRQLDGLRERVSAYMLKAVRESKSRTSWTESDAAFEAALTDFVNALFDEERARGFRAELGRLVARIARPGLWNALSRTLVHLTSPGTPDLYQGDELWNFALVDPDNRRPVDYALRDRLLAEVERGFAGDTRARAAYVAELVAGAEDGRIKLHVTHRALVARRERAALFHGGHYTPLAADGARAAHVFAFAMQRAGTPGDAVVVVVPRLVAAMTQDGRAPIGELWGDSRLRLPTELAGATLECLLTGRQLRPAAAAAPGADAALLLADILATFPVALLATSGAGNA